MPLADTQGAIRDVIVGGRPPQAVLAELVDAGDKAYRFSIHQRHFEASLVTVLRSRFPTLEWLLGSEFLTAAAALFAHRFPPARPCMAEYGEDFPAFVASRPGAERMPWLAALGTLEWHVGATSVATSAPPLPLEAMADVGDADLGSIMLTVQPTLRYVEADWPVDELIALRLSRAAPEELTFNPMAVHLEVSGGRGDFRVNRLVPGSFAFRSALRAGRSLGEALQDATGREQTFEPGAALAALFAEGLVTAIGTSRDRKATP